MTIRPILTSLLFFPVLLGVASGQRIVVPPPVFHDIERVTDSVFGLTKELIEVVNDNTVSEDYRKRAMVELGRLRRDEALVPLLNQLLFTGAAITEPGPFASFPAGQAVLPYGSDLYPKLLGVLLEERSPEYVYVLACLVHNIDGKRIALLRIEKLQAEEGLTEIQRQNITRLINRLKTTDFDDPRNWPRPKLSEQVKVDLRAEPAD